MYTKRHIEKTIEKAAHMFPAMVLSGPRQVGKTTLLKHYANNDYKYVTFDDQFILRTAAEDPLGFIKTYADKTIIDEVQQAPEIFSALKISIDENRKPGKYLITGSQRFQLMSGVSESLAGRTALLDLYGYSLRELNGIDFYAPFLPTKEYLEGRKDSVVENNNIWETIHKGSFPELYNRDMDWEMFYSNYVKLYIEKDVRQLAMIQDELLFSKFMIIMASRSGELLNYGAIARDLSITVDTVKRWTSILKASGIVILLEPYFNNALKRAIKTPKIYFTDTGLACYLSRWNTPDTLKNGARAGHIFENFIVMEIIKSYVNAGKDISNIYFYRDKSQHEIDLIINDNNVLYPIEIRSSSTPHKEWANSFKYIENIPGTETGPGTLICQYDKQVYINENLLVLPISYL